MKKLAMVLVMLLVLTPLIPAAAETAAPVMPVYVWLQDIGIDFEGILAQIPTMKEMQDRAGTNWSQANINHSFSYTQDDETHYGDVWYNEDGSVNMVRLSNLLADLYFDTSMSYYSDDVRFLYGTEEVMLNVWTEEERSQTLAVYYDVSGRMRSYVYSPADDVSIQFDRNNHTLTGKRELAEIEESYGLPQLMGGKMSAPDVRIYAAFQDTGIDAAALLKAAPHPREGERETVGTDAQGNVITAAWNADGSVVTELQVTFAEPVDDFWTGMSVYPQFMLIDLNSPSCHASYEFTGTLESYNYQVSLDTWLYFDPAGNMQDVSPEEEALLAAYAPLEIIGPSQDYSGEKVLNMERATTQTVYATLSDAEMNLQALLGMALKPLDATEQDGLLIVSDDDYSQFAMDYYDRELDEYDTVWAA